MENLKLGGLEEVRDWEWSPSYLAQQIDQFVADSIENLSTESFGSQQLFGEIYIRYPQCWKMIYRDRGELLGFWHLIPLKDDAYQQSIRGELCGSKIRLEMIPDLVPGTNCDAYFSSLSIDKSVRNSLMAVAFSGTILQALVSMAESSIFFRNISMCFCSDEASTMNRTLFQFEPCAAHPVSGTMYQANMSSFLNRPLAKIAFGKNFQSLRRLYQQSGACLNPVAA